MGAGSIIKPIGSAPSFSVSEFVAVFNQSLEITFPSVTIVGELSNFRVNRGQWVYFDLKDDAANVKFFGTSRQLPGPLEDGLILEVRGRPRLHPNFGFSINIDEITVSGEGSIRRAQDLLARKLSGEGLFDDSRKRSLPYPPVDIGVISAHGSAALADFRKILDQRWGKARVRFMDTAVQGEGAPNQIVKAIQSFNELADAPEVLVIIRGGGSADDLAAFSTESVVRAVAASRIPTLVAVGHEVDVSLAELAADRRASTPSNAAELLVPDASSERIALNTKLDQLAYSAKQTLDQSTQNIQAQKQLLAEIMNTIFKVADNEVESRSQFLALLDPRLPMKRGFALVRNGGRQLRSTKDVDKNDSLSIEFVDGIICVKVNGAGRD